jgi:uncharacterized membrane protein HdeD (DUF308 family)
MLVIAGVTQVINAFQIRNWGKYLIWLLVGFLYIAAGFVSFESPLLVATLFTFLLGISLTASGTMRIFPAFNIREGMPWMGVALSGTVTLAPGPHHSGALAGLGLLYPRPPSRHRSDLCRSRLDRIGLGLRRHA